MGESGSGAESTPEQLEENGMPSFDIVSEVVWHEVGNAVDQANREINNRYDFKGSDAEIEQAESVLTILADDEYKVGRLWTSSK